MITNEVMKKAAIATTSRESETRKESLGGARYTKHRTATTETTIDEKKSPARESSATTIRHSRTAVARFNRSRYQIKASDPRPRLPTNTTAFGRGPRLSISD